MVSLIISNPNRTSLLKKSVYTLLRNYDKPVEFVFIEKINLNPNDVEFKSFCEDLRKQNHIVKIIQLDDTKTKLKINNPAHTLNIGFWNASNEVCIKTDPENLHCYDTIKYIEDNIKENTVIFGKILHSTSKFRDEIDNGILDYTRPELLLDNNGVEDLKVCSEKYKNTYYYIMGINRSDFIKVGGICEDFMEGLAGEDDDFGDMLKYANLNLIWTDKIVGIHLNHEKETGDYRKLQFTDVHNRNIELLNKRRFLRNKKLLQIKKLEL